MTLLMNEMGEFVDGGGPDPDERRASVYAAIRAVDPASMDVPPKARRARPPSAGRRGDEARCDFCGGPYMRRRRDQRFCCRKCSNAHWYRASKARPEG